MSEIRIEIALPTDNDGFVLFQCPLCVEFFKLRPNDIEADDVIDTWCPCCGLKSDTYVTDDVIDLAEKMTKNIADNITFKEMEQLERQFNGNDFSFKVGKRPQEELEKPIIASIEALEVEKYKCCKREAKIKPVIKICSSYCPYCGVRYDEHK